jgi:phospholipid/cholesterol/gamma-HCH transport system substrate-binding protein
MINLRNSSKGLNENMNAAKENFLLRGYFNRKAKADQKKIDDAAALKSDEKNAEIKKK